ncbi:F-actin-capping protein subunit alpha [Tulasnella sp. 403]|nr:F-actin-capping protein subunit alpha [Tulasnella sp. 403]
MKQAEQHWDELLRRQSRSFHEAVYEYRRRYGRSPPRGFDSWFSVENNVTLIDEVSRESYAWTANARQHQVQFDQIDRDIAPFLAIPPEAVATRVAKAESHFDTYHITVNDGDVDAVGGLRARDMLDFLADIAPNLPNMTFHVSFHDMGPHVYGDDFRAEVKRVLAQGTYLSPEAITRFESKKRNPRKTVTKACFDDAPAVLRERGILQRDPADQFFRFIYDHLATMDYCNNPDVLDNNGIFLYNLSGDSFIFPLFVQSKLRQGGNILYPSLVRFQDFSKAKIMPWSERSTSKLFWRGRMTGSHHSTKLPWQTSHRIRLHNIANNETFSNDVVNLLVEDSKRRVSRKKYSRKVLNSAYLDTGLISPPIQCAEEDGTCDAIEREIKFLAPVWGDVGRNKYVLDIDGNGWSARYQALLASGSLVLKSTIFPEWNTDWLVPYYHYVPVQHDYSDLYDVMSFFAGSPDGHGRHEDLAEKIGMRGAEFVRRHWRREDIQAYMYRLLLEYARAISPDREAMSYKD